MTGAVGGIGKEMIPLEIEPTRQAIKATLWSGNIKLARTLISKRVAQGVCADTQDSNSQFGAPTLDRGWVSLA